MTVGEQGHFCSNCQKSVVDFSNYTDKELLDYFTKIKERTCGRISNNQLNRLIVVGEPANTPVYRRLLFGAAITAGVISTAHSQNNAPVTTRTIQPNQKTNKEKPPVSDSTIKISGRVIDSASKKPLPYANMMVVCDSNQITFVHTDDNGKFEASIDKKLLGKKLTIIVTQYGYHDGIKSFMFTANPPKHFAIRMSQIPGFEGSHFIMGDIEMTPPAKKDSTKITK